MHRLMERGETALYTSVAGVDDFARFVFGEIVKRQWFEEPRCPADASTPEQLARATSRLIRRAVTFGC